tara:strand:+ start:9809 stop:10369 length:561 start_codon:yes stop_codon:yes gene_type:complete
VDDWARSCASAQTRTITVDEPGPRLLEELPSRLLLRKPSNDRPALRYIAGDPPEEYGVPGAVPSMWTRALTDDGDAWVFDLQLVNANTLEVTRLFRAHESPPNMLADFVCLVLVVLLMPDTPHPALLVAPALLVLLPHAFARVRAGVAVLACAATTVLIAADDSSAASAVLLSLGAAMAVPYAVTG